MLNPKNTLNINDIEKICVNIIENELWWYEKETEEFFMLIEKPLNFKLSLFLTRIKNDLIMFDEQIMKKGILKNENLKYPFSQLHKLVNKYYNNIDDFYYEIFNNQYDENTSLIELLEDRFYFYAEQVLKENEKFNSLNEDLQIEIVSQFTPLEHLNKQDAMVLLNLLI